jgi:lipopolysaccharide/colanic/teichoic acid biosynthesis glycosyltransferase
LRKPVFDSLKRCLDLLAALVALVLLAPLLVMVALVILVTVGRPIVFAQERPGCGGEPFTLYKFRTMFDAETSTDAESEKARVTSVGRLLRALSLDELPQLWNIVRGDMSFVGPRPLLMQYLPLYNARQYRRHEVRPGLSGLAQVSGRNRLSWEEKFELDVTYVEKRSFSLDALILLKSIGVVISRHGVNAKGNAWVEPFGPA